VATRSVRRGEPALERSVAESLLTSLNVPVSVVGRHVYPGELIDRGAGRVLLALSLNAFSRGYVDFACGLARARRAHVSLLHVLHTRGITEQGSKRAHNAARMCMAALAATQSGLCRQPEIAVREGDTVGQILEEAVCPGQDLIILGSSPALLESRGPHDNIVSRVIAETRCPVMILKPQDSISVLTADQQPELRTGSLN
jgi:nucleotide-binding universal stress UspA family protein